MLSNASSLDQSLKPRPWIAAGIATAIIAGVVITVLIQLFAPAKWTSLFFHTGIGGMLVLGMTIMAPISRTGRIGAVCFGAAIGASIAGIETHLTMAWVTAGILLVVGAIGIGREVAGY